MNQCQVRSTVVVCRNCGPGTDMVRCINAAQWPTKIEGNRAYHEDVDAVIIDGPGHFLMMETSEQFNAHLALIVEELSEPM